MERHSRADAPISNRPLVVHHRADPVEGRNGDIAENTDFKAIVGTDWAG